MTAAKTDDLDVDTLVSMLGGLPEHRDQRLDLPLTEQVQILLDLACAHRPDFQRNVPVKATDHDIVICEVLVKLITALAERSGPAVDIADVRELFDRFIESGMAEDEDSELLERLHEALTRTRETP